MKFSFVAALLAVMGPIAAPAALAGTYYVDQRHPSASDSSAGTSESLPWKTIQKGANTAVAGDTVIVKAGIYREQVTMQRSGTASQKITLLANPGERVVIDAADQISGWTQLPEALARGNPNFRHIYYKDLSFLPTRIDEDEKQIPQARMPVSPLVSDWWKMEAGTTTTTIVDAAHLTAADAAFYKDARYRTVMHYISVSQSLDYSSGTVTDYDPATHTLTLSGTLSRTPRAGIDAYYLYNKLELLTSAGQWVSEPLGGGSHRIFVWPSDGADANIHLYEGTRRYGCLSWGVQSHIVFDGFECRHGTNYEAAIGARSGAVSDITIQNCVAHGHDYKGIGGSSTDGLTVRRCISTDNSFGFMLTGASNTLVEESEFSWNKVDGIVLAWTINGAHVRRCYSHNHYLGDGGHPDNGQTHNTVNDVWYEDSAFIMGGQSFMMETTDNAHFVNSLIAGSIAYMVLCGAGHVEMKHCTLAMSGYGMGAFGSAGIYTITDNILYSGHSNMMYEAFANTGYTSDRNVFYQGPGITGTILVWTVGPLPTDRHWNTWAKYLQESGQDGSSVNLDPQFVNAPVYFDRMENHAFGYFTPSKVYIETGYSNYAVGDHIEINMDGVVRHVTGKGTEVFEGATHYYLEFDPPYTRLALWEGTISNWKTNDNFAMDFAVRPGSPAIGRAEGGGTCGSTVNLAQFKQGDMNGDGLRELPNWPPKPVTVSAGLDYDWVYQNAPTTTGGRHQSLLTISVTDDPNANSDYSVSLAANPGSAGKVTLESTANPLVWVVKGGQCGVDPVGSVTINLIVRGLNRGGQGSASAAIAVRPLGDITGNGVVGLDDKVQMNKRLNGLPTPGYGDRHFDLDASGVVGLGDKVILNKILNGLPIP